MKKILTLLLALTLVFGTSAFTYAAENESESNVPTHVFETTNTNYDGTLSKYRVTIKGIAGVQLTENKCLWKPYNCKFADIYLEDETYFDFDEDYHSIWKGNGELTDGIVVIPVTKGAEITIETIEGQDTTFFPGYYPFIDDENSVLCHGDAQTNCYGSPGSVTFDEITDGYVEDFPLNTDGKLTGILVVEPGTYPQPTQEEIDNALKDIKTTTEKIILPAEDAETTENEDLDSTSNEVIETENTEAVPGLDNFTVKNEYANETFNDVADTDWFNNSVKYCYETGLMSGKGANSFDPNGSISLAEAITLAARTNKIYSDKGNKFEETGDNWYDCYVAYAIENNIIEKGQFTDYTRNITRAELAYLFAHSVASEELKAIQLYTVPDVDFDTPYSDEIFTLFNAGIVTGSDEDRTFYPNNDITRGEAATLIFRVLNPDSRVSF